MSQPAALLCHWSQPQATRPICKTHWPHLPPAWPHSLSLSGLLVSLQEQVKGCLLQEALPACFSLSEWVALGPRLRPAHQALSFSLVCQVSFPHKQGLLAGPAHPSGALAVTGAERASGPS